MVYGCLMFVQLFQYTYKNKTEKYISIQIPYRYYANIIIITIIRKIDRNINNKIAFFLKLFLQLYFIILKYLIFFSHH